MYDCVDKFKVPKLSSKLLTQPWAGSDVRLQAGLEGTDHF